MASSTSHHPSFWADSWADLCGAALTEVVPVDWDKWGRWDIEGCTGHSGDSFHFDFGFLFAYFFVTHRGEFHVTAALGCDHPFVLAGWRRRFVFDW